MVSRTRLDEEERDLLESYERDEWQSVAALREQREQYQGYALGDLEARGLVSIVLSDDDLQAIRRQAEAVGLPYQRFIADIVHQFVAGALVRKSSA